MENAGQEHIIRLTLDDGASEIKNELQDNFPNYKLKG